MSLGSRRVLSGEKIARVKNSYSFAFGAYYYNNTYLLVKLYTTCTYRLSNRIYLQRLWFLKLLFFFSSHFNQYAELGEHNNSSDMRFAVLSTKPPQERTSPILITSK